MKNIDNEEYLYQEDFLDNEIEENNIKESESSNGYIDNNYLRSLIVKYNEMNYNDDGSWCEAYLRKLEKKYTNSCNVTDLESEMKKSPKKFITKEKYENSKKFILKKMDSINTLRTKYYNEFTQEERRKFDFEFEKVKADICEAFSKVIDGRVISFKLIASKDPDEINDIKQDALFSLFTYINRFDADQNTSAFAYVTSQISNAIKLSLNEAKKHAEREITGLDFYDNLNTIDDFRGEFED